MPSVKIENGGSIQDGGEKVFFHFKISKTNFFQNKQLCCIL
jgi:hypothetical protein